MVHAYHNETKSQTAPWKSFTKWAKNISSCANINKKEVRKSGPCFAIQKYEWRNFSEEENKIMANGIFTIKRANNDSKWNRNKHIFSVNTHAKPTFLFWIIVSIILSFFMCLGDRAVHFLLLSFAFFVCVVCLWCAWPQLCFCSSKRFIVRHAFIIILFVFCIISSNFVAAAATQAIFCVRFFPTVCLLVIFVKPIVFFLRFLRS